MQKQLQGMIDALAKARGKKDECVRQCEKVRGEVSVLRARVAAAAPADIQALSSRLEGIRRETGSARQAESALTRRMALNESLQQSLQQCTVKIASQEAYWSWLRDLRDVFCGRQNGKDKLDLETYVLAKWFELIMQGANKHLLRMTSGQYEFCLEGGDAPGGNSKTGLDLSVKDNYQSSGSVRSVRTLSGGESFKAALALALGLSDIVQERSGGIRLDTLFIDEGFGSLDDQSLDQAMRVLETMSGSRLIGIISHVGELKRRIERQVIVKKEKQGGSSIRMEL